jgi:hypothetical protein
MVMAYLLVAKTSSSLFGFGAVVLQTFISRVIVL